MLLRRLRLLLLLYVIHRIQSFLHKTKSNEIIQSKKKKQKKQPTNTQRKIENLFKSTNQN